MSRLKFFDEEETDRNLDHDSNILLPKLGKYFYQVLIGQQMFVNNRDLVNTSAAALWELEIKEIDRDSIIVSLNTVSFKLEESAEIQKPLINFGLLFNRPINKLEIELHSNGTIKAVLNQGEISKIWQKIKENELLPYQNDDAIKGIFLAGDSVFSNSLNMLIENPLYLTFFENIYNVSLEETNIVKKDVRLYSKIFPGNYVKLINHKDLQNNSENVIFKNNFVNKEPEEGVLKKIYFDDFQKITGETYNYDYKLQSESKYSKKSGTLSALKAKCAERVNDNLINISTYNITLKDESTICT